MAAYRLSGQRIRGVASVNNRHAKPVPRRRASSGSASPVWASTTTRASSAWDGPPVDALARLLASRNPPLPCSHTAFSAPDLKTNPGLTRLTRLLSSRSSVGCFSLLPSHSACLRLCSRELDSCVSVIRLLLPIFLLNIVSLIPRVAECCYHCFHNFFFRYHSRASDTRSSLLVPPILNPIDLITLLQHLCIPRCPSVTSDSQEAFASIFAFLFAPFQNNHHSWNIPHAPHCEPRESSTHRVSVRRVPVVEGCVEPGRSGVRKQDRTHGGDDLLEFLAMIL